MSSSRAFTAAMREWLNSESEGQFAATFRSLTAVMSMIVGVWGLVGLISIVTGDVPAHRLPGALLMIAGALASLASRRAVFVSDSRRYSVWGIAGTVTGCLATYLSWVAGS